ncbi:hypothetical protein [Onishia taeanensis]|uniref:Uncharacterized protein n=1 Tax=Onishia taeanensis TaxID=284577 RepID=A0A328XPU1_9GAMM|nr:hypothetical protein [Halomonas taeanensis]RAR60931.1 hypothetical protein BCL93_106136 [Halomonas taeanensis]
MTRRHLIRAGMALLILPIVVLLGIYFLELGDVRGCMLDGGHWDYLDGVCRDTPQPFVPWLVRAPWLVNGGLALSVLGLGMTMAGLYIKKR